MTNPTRTKRREKTVEITHMELLKLTSDGYFWHGCECVACEHLRVKLAAAFPTFAHELVRRANPS